MRICTVLLGCISLPGPSRPLNSLHRCALHRSLCACVLLRVELAPQEGELDLLKPGKGAFYNTQLEAHLRQHGVSHLLVCGVTTEVSLALTLSFTHTHTHTHTHTFPPLPLSWAPAARRPSHGTLSLPHCILRAQVCVQTTVREANDRGFDCCVLADACASYFPVCALTVSMPLCFLPHCLSAVCLTASLHLCPTDP